MFAALGVLVALYTTYATITGEVYAKAGPGARLVSREESPGYFWTVIAIYAGLGVALITVF
ncbi:MAG TPA: hypothetical protein VML54_02350 [Candidatus Limnocylindrales bacterium]|nr:hypothetical protein [Candidatus Limnocylindrales bacterium]